MMTAQQISELAQDCSVTGTPEALEKFAQAVNNPATGEALYEIYAGAMRHPSRGVWTWEDLTSEERHAWSVVADGHRAGAPSIPTLTPEQIRKQFEKSCPQFDMRRGAFGYKDDETSCAFEGFKAAIRNLGL